MDRTITFKMTRTFELTFEDFFERYYNADQEEKALKAWEIMLTDEPIEHIFEDEFDEWDTEISEMNREAEKTIEEENQDETKCFWCNARGVDKQTSNGTWIHADCGEGE